MHPNNYMVKFADDTVLLSLLHNMDPSVYQDEIDLFIKWCDTNHLILNVTKTQEMVLDPRQVTDHEPVVIKNQDQGSPKDPHMYLGVHIDNLFCWKTHIDNLLQQRLYFCED